MPGKVYLTLWTYIVYTRFVVLGLCQQTSHRASRGPRESPEGSCHYRLRCSSTYQIILRYVSVQLIHPDPKETKGNPSETAGYKGKIYGEPTRELHKLFGLTSNLDMTPSGEERKGYISTRPYLVRVLISIWVSLVVLRVADVKGVWRW